ncbi:hypothetical protein [Leclercia adecarboxylata]|uniref:hypothetical protein n=1 Tax=Leclercia adecarboxylata TaxID=83655 RepID=UPI00254B77DB|nr:hypothetical protein [Leclercia adecarboxylata]
MMKYIIAFMSFAFCLCDVSAAGKPKVSNDSTVNKYRVYSLARCITDNYIKMGADFNKLSIKDNTMGFIDMDNGLAFSAEQSNELDAFIRKKTGTLYQLKQESGDLASVNLVIYDCVDFYRSKELNIFLNEFIKKSESQ